jgi:predicted short-subunit dehydrogenase-like oxidoreductase (DUF2520 family)
MKAEHQPERIGFIGAGKVAQTLAAAFTQAGWTVACAYSRNPANLAALIQRSPETRGMTESQAVVDAGTLVFLTVTDDEIERVCSSLAWREGIAAVHCSGATELSALRSSEEQGALTGGFHPMQMFANPDVALRGLAGCTVGVEAKPPLRDILESLAHDIGCVPFALPAGARAAYHASACYVGPFLIALLQEAVKLWERFGAGEPDALRALVPLLNGTVDAVMDGGLARGMGGCVARGDLGTLRKHLDALDSMDPAAGTLYRELGLRNVPLGLKRGSLSADRAEEIEMLLRSLPQESLS